MADLSDRIARLPPEKRALLLQKLAGQPAHPAATPQAARAARGPRAEWAGFCCRITTPGHFAGLEFHELEPTPPGPGQIQIKARAFSLNFRDLMIAMNLYPPTPGVPSIMGSDYAGEVLACGDGVTDFAPGDEVIALSAGHFTPDAQLVPDCHFCAVSNVSARQAVPKPKRLSFAQAAGVPTVFLTSFYALHHVARLRRGERVLIHSATGGVGLAAVQVASWLGARIFATAGSEEKRAYLRGLGIEHPMDSRSTEFADRVLALTGGQGVDVILNTLSGAAVDRGLEVLDFFGRFLQIDKQDIAREGTLRLAPFRRGLTFAAIDLALFLGQPDRLRQLLLEIAEHLERGDFQPVPHTAYPIAELPEALTCMSRAKHIGKLVLTFD